MLQRLHLAHSPQRRFVALAVGAHTLRLWMPPAQELHSGGPPTTSPSVLEMSTGRMEILALSFVSEHALLCVHADGVLQLWHLFPPSQVDDQLSSSLPPHLSIAQQTTRVDQGEFITLGTEQRIEHLSQQLVARLGWEFDLGLRLKSASVRFDPMQRRTCAALGGVNGEAIWLTLTASFALGVLRLGTLESCINLVSISEDCSLLATACRDHRVAVWRPADHLDAARAQEGPWRVLEESKAEVWVLSFSHSSRYLAGGCIDNGVYLWDLKAQNSLRARRYDHEGWISDIAWSEDDRVLACASWDNTVGVFRGADLMPLYRLDLHRDYVSNVLFIPHSTYLVSASYDGRLAVWDWSHALLVRVLEGHTDWIQALAYAGEGTFLSAASDRVVMHWSAISLTVEAQLSEGPIKDRLAMQFIQESLSEINSWERPMPSRGFIAVRSEASPDLVDSALRRALEASYDEIGEEISVLFEDAAIAPLLSADEELVPMEEVVAREPMTPTHPDLDIVALQPPLATSLPRAPESLTTSASYQAIPPSPPAEERRQLVETWPELPLGEQTRINSSPALPVAQMNAQRQREEARAPEATPQLKEPSEAPRELAAVSQEESSSSDDLLLPEVVLPSAPLTLQNAPLSAGRLRSPLPFEESGVHSLQEVSLAVDSVDVYKLMDNAISTVSIIEAQRSEVFSLPEAPARAPSNPFEHEEPTRELTRGALKELFKRHVEQLHPPTPQPQLEPSEAAAASSSIEARSAEEVTQDLFGDLSEVFEDSLHQYIQLKQNSSAQNDEVEGDEPVSQGGVSGDASHPIEGEPSLPTDEEEAPDTGEPALDLPLDVFEEVGEEESEEAPSEASLEVVADEALASSSSEVVEMAERSHEEAMGEASEAAREPTPAQEASLPSMEAPPQALSLAMGEEEIGQTVAELVMEAPEADTTPASEPRVEEISSEPRAMGRVLSPKETLPGHVPLEELFAQEPLTSQEEVVVEVEVPALPAGSVGNESSINFALLDEELSEAALRAAAEALPNMGEEEFSSPGLALPSSFEDELSPDPFSSGSLSEGAPQSAPGEEEDGESITGRASLVEIHGIDDLPMADEAPTSLGARARKPEPALSLSPSSAASEATEARASLNDAQTNPEFAALNMGLLEESSQEGHMPMLARPQSQQVRPLSQPHHAPLGGAAPFDRAHSEKTNPSIRPLREAEPGGSFERNEVSGAAPFMGRRPVTANLDRLDESGFGASPNPNQTFFGGLVYDPAPEPEPVAQVGNEITADGFPDISEVLSQPEYTPYTPEWQMVEMSQLWQQRSVARQAAMKIFKRRAMVQRESWRASGRIEAGLHNVFALTSRSEAGYYAASGARRHITLWSNKDELLYQLPSQGRIVYALTSTPDGRLVLSGDDKANIDVWLIEVDPSGRGVSNLYRSRLEGHSAPISHLAVNSSGRLLLSSSLDGTARLWNLEDGTCVSVLEHNGESLTAGDFWGSGLVTISLDGVLRVWDRRGIQIDLVEGFAPLTCMVARRNRIFFGSRSGEIHAYERGQTTLFGHHDAEVRGMSLHIDGTLVTAGRDGCLKIHYEDEQAPLELRTDAVLTCVQIDGTRIIAGTESGRLAIFSQR